MSKTISKTIPFEGGTVTQRVAFDLSRKDYTWMTMDEIRELFNVDRDTYMRIYNWGYVRAVRRKGDYNEVVVVEAEANKLIERFKSKRADVKLETPVETSAIMPPEIPLPNGPVAQLKALNEKLAPAPEEKLASLNWKHQAKVAAKVEKLHSLADLAKVTPQVSLDAPAFDELVATAVKSPAPSTPPAPPPINNNPADRFPKDSAERIRITQFLVANYLIDKACWKGSWTDQLAAEHLSTSTHYVTNIRRSFFGTGWGNEDMDKTRQQLVDFESRITQHIEDGKKLLDQLNTLKAQLRTK